MKTFSKTIALIALSFLIIEGYGQTNIVQAIYGSPYFTYGHGQDKAHDGIPTTYYENDAQLSQGNVSLSVVLTKTVKAVQIIVKADKPGIALGDYYITMNGEEEFLYVNPDGFNTFYLDAIDKTYYKVKEIEVYEIPLDAVSMPFAYDDAGNMITRQIVFSGTKLAKISTDGDGLEPEVDEEKAFTEILGESTVNIFPNPTKGQLKVEVTNYSDNATYAFKLYSMAGKLIYSSTQHSCVIDLSTQPQGMYILELNVNNEVQRWKIIKE